MKAMASAAASRRSYKSKAAKRRRESWHQWRSGNNRHGGEEISAIMKVMKIMKMKEKRRNLAKINNGSAWRVIRIARRWQRRWHGGKMAKMKMAMKRQAKKWQWRRAKYEQRRQINGNEGGSAAISKEINENGVKMKYESENRNIIRRKSRENGGESEMKKISAMATLM